MNFKKIFQVEEGVFPVYFMKLSGVNDIYINLVVKVGSRDDVWPNQAGLAHFLEHMVFVKTRRFKNYEVDNFVQNCGGDINAITSKEVTIFKLVLPKIKINKGFLVLSNILFESVFSQKNIELEKNIVLNELKLDQEDLESSLEEEFYKNILSYHPLAHDIFGSEEAISNFTLKDCKKFYKKFYNLSNMVLLVAGNISKKEIINLVQRHFSSRFKGKKNIRVKVKNPHSLIKDYFIIKPEIKQTKFFLGSLIFPTEEKNILILSLFKLMLDHSLFQELRAKRGLIYQININTYTWTDFKIFSINGSCCLKHIDEVKKIIFQTIQKIKNDKILFKKAKFNILNLLLELIKNPDMYMEYIIYNYLIFDKEPPSFEGIYQLVNDIKLDQIQKFVDKYLTEEKFYNVIFLN